MNRRQFLKSVLLGVGAVTVPINVGRVKSEPYDEFVVYSDAVIQEAEYKWRQHGHIVVRSVFGDFLVKPALGRNALIRA